MKSTLEKMIEALPALTEDDLVTLSKSVNAEWRARIEMKTKKLRVDLKPGDTVTFTGRHRTGRGRKSEHFPVQGIVTKVKRKRALVTSTCGGTWDVNLRALTKLV